MSNVVFPLNIAGMQLTLKRTPVLATDVQTASNGYELRASWQTYPRYKYSAQIEFLRTAALYSEFQRVMTAFVAAAGQYDTFLIQDPEDYQATQHGFAVADGSATLYQLQRTLGGARVSGYWDATAYPVLSVPRTNLVLYSADCTNAAWVKSSAGTGSAPIVTGDFALAPDGTFTAARVQLNRGAGNTAGDYSQIYVTGAVTAGAAYTSSVWLKSNSGSSVAVQLYTGLGPVQLVTVTPTWQRFTVSGAAASTAAYVNPLLVGNGGTASSADLSVWGAQLEPGSQATAYIPTTSASVTINPGYWPQYGDGFEPVTEVNPASLTVYNNGGALAQDGTAYTLQTGGGVLFASPPAGGSVLTATYQYFRRVRFASDSLDLDRMFVGLWSGKKLDFISVK